jgi:hypothetical protein
MGCRRTIVEEVRRIVAVMLSALLRPDAICVDLKDANGEFAVVYRRPVRHAYAGAMSQQDVRTNQRLQAARTRRGSETLGFQPLQLKETP